MGPRRHRLLTRFGGAPPAPVAAIPIDAGSWSIRYRGG